MQNLLWLLLNVGLSIFLLVICVKIARQINKRHGIWAALIFVFIVLSAGGNRKSDQESGGANKWEFATTDRIVSGSL